MAKMFTFATILLALALNLAVASEVSCTKAGSCLESMDLETDAGLALSSSSMGSSKEEYAAAFTPAESSEQADWAGTYVDLFSPDDTNPDSRRFIDLDESSGELQVSADTGGEKWGRRFDKTTSVNPILVSTDAPNARKTSFLSKVPKDAPVHAEALAGALNFTLILGTALGEKVIKWNGLYDGKGGLFGGNEVPASDCDNFWRRV